MQRDAGVITQSVRLINTFKGLSDLAVSLKWAITNHSATAGFDRESLYLNGDLEIGRASCRERV